MEKRTDINRRRTILHVDMDAFYAAVEQLDNPEYRKRPVVVGADPAGGRGRGVVSAASYEARRFGIRSAQPISRAYHLCPGAVFLKPRFGRYTELSKKVMAVLDEFSPLVEQISIDEAFIDCTGTERIFESGERIAKEIKGRIMDETGLTASVGVASNKSVAKIASELGKPDGLTICPPGGEREFLERLPLRYLWGAGKKTIERLARMGVESIGDVAARGEEALEREFKKSGRSLWLLANGVDERPVVCTHRRKSISEEITFFPDTRDTMFIEKVLFEISDRLTRRMRRFGIAGRTVTLKIRLEDFTTFSRSKTLPHAVRDMKTVRALATELFRAFYDGEKRVRLVGIGVSNLEQQEQLELFSEDTPRDAERLFDAMKEKYGDKITRGSFL
ncbi:MAG: DNA polymerase IV [Spirochaetes bacterium]|nr:DNA polymerase IV [Spirochaetota bacterium]